MRNTQKTNVWPTIIWLLLVLSHVVSDSRTTKIIRKKIVRKHYLSASESPSVTEQSNNGKNARQKPNKQFRIARRQSNRELMMCVRVLFVLFSFARSRFFFFANERISKVSIVAAFFHFHCVVFILLPIKFRFHRFHEKIINYNFCFVAEENCCRISISVIGNFSF